MPVPTYSEAVIQINSFIISNGNNEITANVLNPVLKVILDFANSSIGNLGLLTTSDTDTIVEAINSLKTDFDNLNNSGVQLLSGYDDPNVTPPVTYNYADFYMELDVTDDSPIQLWQWNGTAWTTYSSVYSKAEIDAIVTELQAQIADLPSDYSNIVYVNSVSPSTATIFDINNPPVANNNLLKNDVANLYIGNDGSTWTYNTSPAGYVTKVVSSLSNFYIENTLVDSSGNKTANLQRTGGASFGGFLYSNGEIVSKKGASNTVLAGSNFRLFNNSGTEGNLFQLNALNGVDLWNFVSGVWTKTATFSSIGDLTANSFIKTGGTSSQFLKADGSVDSTVYGTVTDISGKENTSNKQNSLATDGSGVKFPTVDAVNAGLATKGSGTVTSISGTNGVTVATGTTTPVIGLGAITPTSTNGVTAATMAFNDATSSIQTQLNGKQASGSYETAFTKNTAFNKNFGAIAGTVAEGNDSRLSDARTPLGGSTNYIQNQNASAQSANMWISGIGKFGENVLVGASTVTAPNFTGLASKSSELYYNMFQNEDLNALNSQGRFKVSSPLGGSANMFPYSNNINALLSMDMYDGDSAYMAQLGFNFFGEIYTRVGTTPSWNKLYHTGNLVNPVTGTLTSGYIPKATGSGTLGNSNIYDNGTNVLIGTTTDNGVDKLQVNGTVKLTSSVQVGDNVAVASATNVGAIRYRSDANNSYADMCMLTGVGVYSWVNIVQNNF